MPDAPIGGSEYHPKPRYPLPPGVKGPAAVPGQGQTVPGATPGATPTGVPGTTQQSQAAPEGVVIQQNLSGQTPATSTQTPTTGKGQTATKAASSPNLLAQPGLAGVQSEIEGQGMATTSSVTGRPLFGIPALPPPGLNISGTSMSNADLGAMGDPTAIIFLIEGTLLQTFQASGQAASKMIEFLQIEQKQQTKNSIQEIQKYVKAVNDAEKISKAMGITGKVTGAINLVICLVVVIVLVVLIVACLFGGEAFEFALIPALLAALMGLGLAIDQVSGGNVTGGLGKGATQLLEAMGVSHEVASILGPILVQVILMIIMLGLILLGGIVNIATSIGTAAMTLVSGGTTAAAESASVAAETAEAAAEAAEAAAEAAEEVAMIAAEEAKEAAELAVEEAEQAAELAASQAEAAAELAQAAADESLVAMEETTEAIEAQAQVLEESVSAMQEAQTTAAESAQTGTNIGTGTAASVAEGAGTGTTAAETATSTTTSVMTTMQKMANWAKMVNSYIQGVSQLGQGILHFQQAQATYQAERAQAEALKGEALNTLTQSYIDMWTMSYQKIIEEWQAIYKNIMQLIQHTGEVEREIAKTAKI